MPRPSSGGAAGAGRRCRRASLRGRDRLCAAVERIEESSAALGDGNPPARSRCLICASPRLSARHVCAGRDGDQGRSRADGHGFAGRYRHCGDARGRGSAEAAFDPRTRDGESRRGNPRPSSFPQIRAASVRENAQAYTAANSAPVRDSTTAVHFREAVRQAEAGHARYAAPEDGSASDGMNPRDGRYDASPPSTTSRRTRCTCRMAPNS